jgi:hypothetical protein
MRIICFVNTLKHTRDTFLGNGGDTETEDRTAARDDHCPRSSFIPPDCAGDFSC